MAKRGNEETRPTGSPDKPPNKPNGKQGTGGGNTNPPKDKDKT